MNLRQSQIARSFLAAVLVGLSTVEGTRAFAQTAALGFTGSNTTVGHGGNSAGTVGWEFTANADLYVTALGYFNYYSNTGLVEDHDVGIYNSTGALLDSATVNAGTGERLDGDFRYTDVSSFELLAGNTYIIAGTMGANASDPVTYSVSGLTHLPSITLDSMGLYADNAPYTTLRYPTLIWNLTYDYFGPNFEVSSSPGHSPEPGGLALLIGSAIAASGFFARHRRK